MKRITKKVLAEMIDELFVKYTIDLRVKEVYCTKYLPREYDRGAAYLVITTANSHGAEHTFLMFSRLSELQHYLNSGYKLKFTLDRFGHLEDEINIAKI